MAGKVNSKVYESRLKSSQADQDTILECEKIRFIFQHRSSCEPHNSSIDIVVLRSHW